MAKKKQDEPPLKMFREMSYSAKDGPTIVSYRSRGFLRDVHVVDTRDTSNKPPYRPEGKEPLALLTRRLRAYLDAKDLPTDKTPYMPKELELYHGYVPEEHGVVEDEDLWFSIAEATTEPLTEDRLSAELLHASLRLLGRFDEDELRDIFRAMYLYHLHSSVGELNNLAMTGAASQKARAQGPQKRSERSRALRKRILDIAQEFWSRHPEYKGRPVNTAKKIVDEVNKERERLYPGSDPLVYKTISDHLRIALKGAD